MPKYKYMSSSPNWPTHTISLTSAEYAFDLLGIDVREDGLYLGTDTASAYPLYWEKRTKEDFTGPLTAEQAREEALRLHAATSRDADEYISVDDFTEALDKLLGLV